MDKATVLEKLRAMPDFAKVDDHTLGRFAQVRVKRTYLCTRSLSRFLFSL